jgi:imidazolonepropionase-like amidohydrolase
MSRILFTNASIFDGTGTQCFRGETLLEDALIEAVSHTSLGLDPATTAVVDCGGATLMPGLVDGHAHLSFGSTLDQSVAMKHRSDEETALLIAHACRAYLDYGFTSAYSGGSTSPAAEVAARDAFASGWLPGPRLRATSFERSPGDTLGPSSRFPSYHERRPQVPELATFVRGMAAVGVDSVKFRLNGISAFDTGSNRIDQFYDDEIEAAARAARESQLSLIAHAYTSAAIRQALSHGFNVLYHCVYADEESYDLSQE